MVKLCPSFVCLINTLQFMAKKKEEEAFEGAETPCPLNNKLNGCYRR